MAAISIRDMRADDLEWVLGANNAATPHVGELTAASLAALFAGSAHARVAETDGRRAAAVICFGPGAPYRSENYLWFQRRYADFLYIDRIFVEPAATGAGIGQLLYRDLERVVGERCAMMACEINERPPNPRSLAFHEKRGFAPIGRRTFEGGARAVVMMAKRLGI